MYKYISTFTNGSIYVQGYIPTKTETNAVDEADKRVDIVNNQQELEYFDSPQVSRKYQ